MKTEMSYLLEVLESVKNKNKPLTPNDLISFINEAYEMYANDQTIFDDMDLLNSDL